MLWDLDSWIAIEPGEINVPAAKRYANFAMNLLPMQGDGEYETLVWPQHRAHIQ